MDSKYKIRLGDTDSINSINSNNTIDMDLQQTSKLLPYPNVVGDVDAYEVFNNERNSCENYRLIVTINPYCTNVLFNTLTEIIRNEGSKGNKDSNPYNIEEKDFLEVITDEENSTPSLENDECFGITNPNRQQMIMNTEYSKDEIGFIYHPGYDFFTNHLLRNQTFKMVNKIEQGVTNNSMESGLSDIINDNGTSLPKTQNSYETCREFFNTILDFMRYSDGTVVKYCKRENINSEPNTRLNKHLYIYDDLLSIDEAINSNLAEENGWFGFVNNSTVASKERTDKTSIITNRKIWKDLDISRVLNNYENCEFIDMYPDRSLFSFNPKVNSFRKRLEFNWNIILTYPYRNDYCPELVTSCDGKTNGLKMMTVTKSLNNNNADTIVFRSFAKHGLQKGDVFSLYIKKEGEDEYTKLSRNLKVTNVGNMSGNDDGNEMFYFYTTDMTLLMEVFELSINTENGKWMKNGEDITTNKINELISTSINEYRIKRIVGNIESEYYIRVFRKLPNLKNKKENLTDEITKNKENFEEYLYGEKLNASSNIVINGTEEPYMIDFNKEQYRLAFNRTIYNDISSQITFTDNIDISHLIDNLGRPLHEFYITIIKNNKGYKEWYKIDHNKEENRYDVSSIYTNKDKVSENVEYSHCFGNISSGFELSNNYSDRFLLDENGEEYLQYNKAILGDISLINELGCFKTIPYETEITERHGINKDEFYGDLVEYNPNECVEHILMPINHRFNTAQRELPQKNEVFKKFEYQEIEVDDYDHTETGEGMTTNKIVVEDSTKYGGVDLKTWQRPEGYFYQAHYPITLKEFGNITQNAHGDIKVKEAKPVQKNGIFIEVTTTLNYGVVAGDIIYVCLDDEENYKNDKWFEFTVGYTAGKNKFYMQPYNISWADLKRKMNDDAGVEYNWITLSMALTTTEANKRVKLRKKNIVIPEYASRIDHNKFLWRGLYRPGELMDSDLTQYPFANNAFYINKEINFFLKRQDPYGYSGLYCSQAFPNDVEGNHKKEDNYVYKAEEDIVC